MDGSSICTCINAFFRWMPPLSLEQRFLADYSKCVHLMVAFFLLCVQFIMNR